MLLETKGNLDVLRIDSLREQVKDVQNIQTKISKLGEEHQQVSSPEEQQCFIGRHFKDIDEYLHAAESRWDEGILLFDLMMCQLREEDIPPPMDLRRHRTFSDDDGDSVDIDKFRRGDPFWETTTRSHKPGPVVITVVADVGAQAWVPSDKILWRGAAAICLTELLEQAGYRVELWAGNFVISYTTNNRDLFHACLLKGPDDPIDIIPLINSVSGWFKRTIGHAARHLVGNKVDTGYGHSMKIERKHLDFITHDEKVLLCDEIWNSHKAVRLVKRLIATIDPQE